MTRATLFMSTKNKNKTLDEKHKLNTIIKMIHTQKLILHKFILMVHKSCYKPNNENVDSINVESPLFHCLEFPIVAYGSKLFLVVDDFVVQSFSFLLSLSWKFDLCGQTKSLKKSYQIPSSIKLPPFKTLSSWVVKCMVIVMPTFSMC